MHAPRVLLLDGDNLNSLSIAKELTDDLEATVIGAGTAPYSRLTRSTYCDCSVVLPPTDVDTYADALVDVIDEHRPDVVLPVSYESTVVLDAVRAAVPSSTEFCIPSSRALHEAGDKTTTLSYARRLGIDVPSEYSRFVETLEAEGRTERELEDLPFPVFLKARRETGGVTTAVVEDPADFWETYDRIAANAPGGEVLVQEFVDGPDSTYGCGLLFLDNEVELLFGHEELRSAPRHGGSGTHLRIRRDPHLEAKSIQLLRRLGWNGVALVEFKRRPDGSPVLMEINPKFWASYALASRHGYRFASTIVASVLDLGVEPPFGSPAQVGEMVFPLRELRCFARNRDDEPLRESVATVARPGANWAVDRTDLGAWLTPPVDLLRKLPIGESGLDRDRS